jgi:drug/metabolite transporter (DMT)-like permease
MGSVGVLVGLAASVGATLLLSSGTVLQAIDARRVSSQHALRLSLLGRLLRRRLWLLGTFIGYLAFPFELLALSHAPLVLVQPVHALGLLVVLAAGVRFMRERVSAVELVGVVAIIAGLGMVAWGSPASVDSEVSDAAMAGAAVALCALSFVPFILGRRCGRTVLIVCAALGFAGANMAVKGISDHLGAHDYLIVLGYLAVAAVSSITGVINQMSAFQRHRAVEVVPITFAIPTFLPAVLGLLLLHEHWGTAAMAGAPFAAGGFLLALGTVTVGRASAVTRLAVQAAV